MNSVVVHYQEIALKGRNRPWFIERLVRNIRAATEDLDVRRVQAVMGRIELVLGPDADWNAHSRATAHAVRDRQLLEGRRGPFGSRRRSAPPSWPISATWSPSRSWWPRAGRTSAIPSRRRPSSRSSARASRRRAGGTSNLRRPAFTVHVEVLRDRAFYYFDKQHGAGGLPTGVSGRVACLMSGGIDSPVAAWRMMRRGCRAQLIHFHSYPIVSAVSQEKARRLAEVLTRYQQRTRLYLVPFGEVQRRVLIAVPAPLRVVVYRRLMLRIAERLARWEGARALVTGESVGQVASQTLENLTAIGTATTLPVFRPLIGMDKEEIIADAQRIGTYDISIVPDEDCCQLFTPRAPATRATIASVDAAEASLPVAELIDMAVTRRLGGGLQVPGGTIRGSSLNQPDKP